MLETEYKNLRRSQQAHVDIFGSKTIGYIQTGTIDIIGAVIIGCSSFHGMLISSLFHEQGCHRIILYVNLTNTRAQHVYEQLGFTRVRVNENSWTDQLGRQQSSLDYVLYQKDFISYLNG